MKLIIILLFGVLMLASNKQAHCKNIFPYEYKVKTLGNGLKVILIPMNSNGLVAYYTIVRTGSRDEWEPGKSGFAHFFEHMMFRGTIRHPGGMYDSLITSMGADANAYTTDDYTCYHLTITNSDVEKVMDLESDRFQNLTYPESAFKTESGAVYGEFRKGRTSPFNVLWEKIKETAFDKHTYRHTTIGYEADIKDMPNMYEYSKSFYKRYYRPENCILMITGDIEIDSVEKMVAKYYGPWAKGYTAPKIEAEPEQKAERIAEVNYDGKTNPILSISFKGKAFNPNDKTVIAAQILGDLAFGTNSELYKKLYLKEQKVLSLSPQFSMNRDEFLWLIYAMAPEKELNYVQTEILNTVEYFQKNKVDAETLNNIKSRMKYSMLMAMDTPKNVSSSITRFVAMTGGIEQIESYFKTIESITSEDIIEAAKTLTKEKRTIVTLKGAN
jgi:zinc protease